MKRRLNLKLAVAAVFALLLVAPQAHSINLPADYWFKGTADQGFSALHLHTETVNDQTVDKTYLWGMSTFDSVQRHANQGPDAIQDSLWMSPALFNAEDSGVFPETFATVRFGNLLGTHTDPGNYSYFGESDLGKNYLEIWLSPSFIYLDELALGPNVASLGQYDTFASNLDDAGNVLLLRAEFQPGALYVEELSTSGAPNASEDSLFRANLSEADDRAETLGYLDVIDGLWYPQLATGLHLKDEMALLGGALFDPRTRGFDLRLEASNKGATLSGTDWNFKLETGSLTGYAVPEPGFILLLGTGLLGMAGLAGLRRRKQ